MSSIGLGGITPLILTHNEAPNIRATLELLTWARQIIVIDSYSDDDTIVLAGAFDNVRVLRRHFDNHAAQWNFGLDQVQTDRVLTLDADYRCPSVLADELGGLPDDEAAYLAEFQYCVMGKPLRGALYPPRVVLFDPRRFRYIQDGHTQRLDVGDAQVRVLATALIHDDRKPLSVWCASQARYAELEAQKLLDTPVSKLGWKDRLRRWCIVAPCLTLFYCLFVKRLILDGRAGWHYTMQRVHAEWLLGLTLLDRRARSGMADEPSQPATPALAGQHSDMVAAE